jgi:hypothetical protein
MVLTCAVLVAGMANGRAATTTKEVGSFFVATNGNDTNAGTLAMPFAKKGEERGQEPFLPPGWPAWPRDSACKPPSAPAADLGRHQKKVPDPFYPGFALIGAAAFFVFAKW